MKRWTLFAGILVAYSGLLMGNLQAADPPTELEAIAGKWQPTEADLGGNKIDQLVLDSARVTYEGDKYTIEINNKSERGTISLDPKKDPKAMDIFPTEGENNGKTLLAVYEVKGDELKICYSLSPTVRPENFEPASNTLLLVKFKRVKE
jgi:uncharacterized protein (TIGR03067 family)